MPAGRPTRLFRTNRSSVHCRARIQSSALAAVIVSMLMILVANSGVPVTISDTDTSKGSTQPLEEVPFTPSGITHYLFPIGSYSYGSWSWSSNGPHSHVQNHGNEFSMGQDSYSPFACIEQTDQNLIGYFYSGQVVYNGPPLTSVTTRLDVRTQWSQNYGDDGNTYFEVDFQIQKNSGSGWYGTGNYNNMWTYTGKTTNPTDIIRSWGPGVVDGPGTYRIRIYMQVNPPSSGCIDQFWLYIEDFALYGEDNVPPAWVQPPTDRASEYGSSFMYDLDATDPSGIGSWVINSTTLFDIDMSGVITNRLTLPVGWYGIQVSVYDTQNNVLTSTFRVTVQDTTAPTWDIPPTDQIVEFGQAFNYDVHASDLSGISSYWVSLPGQFSIDVAGKITNATYLGVGTYGLEIRAFDPYSRFCSASISVSVQDTTDPTWDQLPTNQVVRLDQAFGYRVNSSDLSGIDYYWVNDTSGFSVDISGLITNKTILQVGIHGLEVRAYDPYGNSVSATFSVTVQAIDPVWEQVPSDKVTELGEPFYYDLNASDVFGITQWWVNATTYFSIDSNGLISNLGLIPVGTHWLEVRAYNFLDRYCSSVFNVTCVDTTAPAWLESPTNQNLEFGNAMSYELTATDLSSIDQWWINDTVLFHVDSSGRITNVGNPPVGRLGIQIWVSDVYGNLLTGAFTVIIEDTTPPAWVEAPTDQTIAPNQPLDYQLSATDLSGIDEWAVNDTIHFSITSDGRITSIGLLDLGSYGVEVTVFDPYGNVIGATFTVLVQGVDTTPPPPELIVLLVGSVAVGALVIITIVIVYLRRGGNT